jgi:hypothetical protein
MLEAQLCNQFNHQVELFFFIIFRFYIPMDGPNVENCKRWDERERDIDERRFRFNYFRIRSVLPAPLFALIKRV